MSPTESLVLMSAFDPKRTFHADLGAKMESAMGKKECREY